jgi:hypothetical protein
MTKTGKPPPYPRTLLSTIRQIEFLLIQKVSFGFSMQIARDFFQKKHVMPMLNVNFSFYCLLRTSSLAALSSSYINSRIRLAALLANSSYLLALQLPYLVPIGTILPALSNPAHTVEALILPK